MQLTKEAIEEFRTLYEEELGETISNEDAAIRALEIVTLYEKLWLLDADATKRDASVSTGAEEGC